MHEKWLNGFLMGKRKWTIYVRDAYSFHGLCFVYVVEAFITLD